MSSRGLIRWTWASLAILGSMPLMARAGEVVTLTRWADEGVLVQGKGMGEDVVRLIAEARWDPSASRDPARYLIRVAFPDGRVDTGPSPWTTRRVAPGSRSTSWPIRSGTSPPRR